MEQIQNLIAIYSRKSRFTGKGESIGNQIELCRDYVANLYGSAAAESAVIFEDEGFSGGNLNRPDFLNMMARARKREFRAIVVYRLDRISRNISDFAGLIDELTRLGVSFVSIREQFDTATPMGRAMMFIISVFSQLERETIAERIRDNMHELAKTGRWLGGNTPTGYESESVSYLTVEGKNRRCCKLKPIPREQALVKTIFDLYTQTDSLTAVEAELLRKHIKTKQGKDFTRFAIKGILQNPVYMAADQGAYAYFLEQGGELCEPKERFDGTRGILAYNRTAQEKGKAAKLLPVSRWILSIGAHPWLISSEQWIGVQRSLARNKVKSYRKPRKNPALLTGLLVCACGERMYPKLSGRQTREGEPDFSYVCRMKQRSKGQRCDQINAPGPALDRAVLEALETIPRDGGAFAAGLREKRRLLTETGEGEDAELSRLRRVYLENEKRLAGLVDSVAVLPGPEAKRRVAERIETLSRENRELETDIRERENARAADAFPEERVREIWKELGYFPDCIRKMSAAEKREALPRLIERIPWDGQTACLVFRSPETRQPKE